MDYLCGEMRPIIQASMSWFLFGLERILQWELSFSDFFNRLEVPSAFDSRHKALCILLSLCNTVFNLAVCLHGAILYRS